MQDFNYQNNFDNQPQEKPAQDLYSYTPATPVPQVIPQYQPNKKKYGVFAVVVAAFLSAVIAAGATFGAFWFYYRNSDSDDRAYANTKYSENDANANININVDEEATSVVEAVATKVTPCVVGIRTTTSVQSFFGDQESSGDGSGVIYRSDGYIITNYHVISDAVTANSDSKIEVFLGTLESKPYNATVVGYNISADIALIKIDKENLPTITFANSSKLKVGQYVITVGNPGGLEFMDSVTYGVISGLDRVVSSDSSVSLIQTDAAINPGNSGGALVNVNGELVGINSSKIVAEEFEGMGFAVPSNTVKSICEKIIEKENSPEPYVGITVSEKYTPEILEYYGYPVGAVVMSVSDGSPAYRAGIRRGDIITRFDSKEIESYEMLGTLVSKCKPGDEVEVEVYRNGRKYKTIITIGSNNQVD